MTPATLTKNETLLLLAGFDISDPLPRKGRSLIIALPRYMEITHGYSVIRVEALGGALFRVSYGADVPFA